MAEGLTFLSVSDVLAIHANTIRHEGGDSGIRDLGLLDSAVSMPRQAFGGAFVHEGIAEMAAAYLYHLCQNHPFVDGNKRVGLSAALIFLMINGVKTLPDPEAALEATMAVAMGTMSKAELVEWMRGVIGES